MRFSVLFLALIYNLAFALSPIYDPEYVALADTGYDACINMGGSNCTANKNLLFRGGQPIPFVPPYQFNFANFRHNVWAYLIDFKKIFKTNATLPNSLEDLSQYRIVVINLMYDFNQQGYQGELNEVENEFMDSGAVTSLQLPKQHKIYGLDKIFNPNEYAFEWWPITFANLNDKDPEYINQSLNWPDHNATPPHSFDPQVYLPLDLSYLISGISYGIDEEYEAQDLHSLLTTLPSDGHPLLIFYHCLAGKDRTGVVSLSYFMQYGGYPYLGNQTKSIRSDALSLSDALKATTLPNRPPNSGALNVAKAYCLSLGKPPKDCIYS